MGKRPYFYAVLPAVGLLFSLATIQTYSDGMLIETYMVDTLFVLDVVSRIALGQTPHVDFTLHLGALPFALICALSENVLIGFLRSQWLLAALLIFAVFWIGRTRLAPWETGFLALAVAFLATSLSPTFDEQITLGLFYNRWAWAIATVLLVLVVLEPHAGGSRILGGVVAGVLLMALLTTKITFFVGLLPVGSLAFALQRRWIELTVTLATCATIMGIVALIVGPSFWLGYLENLVWVAGNPIRQVPGATVSDILAAPRFFAFHLAFLVFVVLYWVTFGFVRALLIVFLGICLIFIQHQNFGQMPVWVFAIAVAGSFCARQAAQKGSKTTLSFGVVTLSCAIFGSVFFYPMAQSTSRNASFEYSRQARLLERGSGVSELAVSAEQAGEVVMQKLPKRSDTPNYMSDCLVVEGLLQVYLGASEELADLKKPVFVVDAQSPYWLSSGNPPLPESAPWNYGSLRGLKNAEYVAIPKCPFKPNYQFAILQRMVDEGVELKLVRETRWIKLMRWSR